MSQNIVNFNIIQILTKYNQTLLSYKIFYVIFLMFPREEWNYLIKYNNGNNSFIFKFTNKTKNIGLFRTMEQIKKYIY